MYCFYHANSRDDIMCAVKRDWCVIFAFHKIIKYIINLQTFMTSPICTGKINFSQISFEHDVHKELIKKINKIISKCGKKNRQIRFYFVSSR